MGKSAKAGNKGRRSARARSSLIELAQVVGNVVGTDAECIAGAALFVLTARKLGYSAAPRAVSMLAVNESESSAAVVVGDPALALYESWFGQDHEVGVSVSESGWNGSGHIVVSVAALNMIFDPTFRQFSRSGMPDSAFIGSVESTQPIDGRWSFCHEDSLVEIHYFLVEGDDTWHAAYAEALSEWEFTASSIAELLRAGANASQLTVEVTT